MDGGGLRGEALRRRRHRGRRDRAAHLGFSLDDPNTFAARIHRMLKLGLNIDEDAAADEDADMPALEEGAAEESKMEEVD